MSLKSILILLLFSINTLASNLDLCHQMCNSSGQGNVGVIQYSMGACICDNEEGWKVGLGYCKILNPNDNTKFCEKEYDARKNCK